MLDADKLNVLNDNILLIAIREERRGGIIRGITTDDKPEMGKVLKVGPGRLSEYTGERLATQVKPGMIVLFNQHTTTRFNINGNDYYVLKEEDLVAYE